MIHLANNGPALVSTSYWSTEHAARGFLYLSVNAGCFRLLMPAPIADAADEMQTADHVVVSVLRRRYWEQERQLVLEWMADDGSDEPWCCHLSPGQVDRIPELRDELPTWEARVYTPGEGTDVVERLVRPAHVRWVDKIPCLEPLAETIRRAAKGED